MLVARGLFLLQCAEYMLVRVIDCVGATFHELLDWLIALLVELINLFGCFCGSSGHLEALQEPVLELLKGVYTCVGFILE